MAQSVGHSVKSIVTEETIRQAREKIWKIAEEKGIKPIKNLDDLKGDFWPEDEDIDDFIATVRRWRNEESEHELPK